MIKTCPPGEGTSVCIRLSKRSVGLLLLFLCLWMGNTVADDPRRVADFRDWSVLSSGSGSEKYCYAITWPKNTHATSIERKPYLLVAHQPGQAVRNQVEVNAGVPFVSESNAKVVVGRRSYELYTVSDGAWMESSVQENRLVSDMKKGSKLIVNGQVGNGDWISDSYSLLGFTAAMKKIIQICR